MTEYNEQQIAALAKRYATGRLDRGDKIRLGKNPELKKSVESQGEYLLGKLLAQKEDLGKASKKTLAQIAELKGQALRGYRENRGATAGTTKPAAEPSTKVSKLVQSMTTSPDATLAMMTEVIRRELTLVEFAARLEVAPATLTKALAMVGLTYEKFRDASVSSSIPMISMLLDALAICADSFANVGDEGISAERSKTVAATLLSAREQILRHMDRPAAKAPSSTVPEEVAAATPSSNEPKNLAYWRNHLSHVDLSRHTSFALDAKLRELASEFIAWSLSKRGEEGEENSYIVSKPWQALLDFDAEQNKLAAPISRQLARFASLVIELCVQVDAEEEWNGNSLLQTLVWLVESGAEGSARALTAACYLAKSPAIATYARDVRSKVIDAIRKNELRIPQPEYVALVSGADRFAA